MPKIGTTTNTTFSTVSPVQQHEMSLMNDGGDNNSHSNSVRTPQNITIEPTTIGGQSLSPEVLPPLQLPYSDNVPLKIGLDISFLAFFAAVIIILVKFCEPFHRGFNCNDESIRYPYHGDTVTTQMLGLYSTLIVAATIILNEFLIVREHCFWNRNLKTQKWKLYFWQLYHQSIPVLFAIIGSLMVTHISKYTIGRLRPHFIDVCRPKILLTGETINRFSNCSNGALYYIDYECTRTGDDAYQMTDARLSFMSGHSSHMAASMIYLIMYIHSRFQWPNYERLKHSYQTVLFSVAFWVSLTRISDYKHHWSDVLVGFLQGATFSILTALYASDLYKFDLKAKQIRNLSQHNPSNFESAVSINMNV